MDDFHVTVTPSYDAEMLPGWRYKLRRYSGPGTASVIESNETWATKEEAGEVCQRANAGDTDGLTFAMYADD